jgi:hypothetical protein
MYTLLYQLPTPTPMPLSGTPSPLQFDLTGFSMWGVSDEAIMVWNRLGSGTTLIQVVVILVIVIAFVRLMTEMAERFQKEDK